MVSWLPYSHLFFSQRLITDIDLVHIARTSAAVASTPPLSNGLARHLGEDNKMAHAVCFILLSLAPPCS